MCVLQSVHPPIGIAIGVPCPIYTNFSPHDLTNSVAAAELALAWPPEYRNLISYPETTLHRVASALEEILAELGSADGSFYTKYLPREQILPFHGALKRVEFAPCSPHREEQRDWVESDIFGVLVEGIVEASEVVSIIGGQVSKVIRLEKSKELVSPDNRFPIVNLFARKLLRTFLDRKPADLLLYQGSIFYSFSIPDIQIGCVPEPEVYEKRGWVIGSHIRTGKASVVFIDLKGHKIEADVRVPPSLMQIIEGHNGRVLQMKLRACRRQCSAIDEGPIYYFLEAVEFLTQEEAGDLHEIAMESRQMYLAGVK